MTRRLMAASGHLDQSEGARGTGIEGDREANNN